MSALSVRPATQAGRFYTPDATALRRELEGYLDAAALPQVDAKPLGFVSPHAGYAFSGRAAACAHKALGATRPDTIFVFAPSHYDNFSGASLWPGKAYATPLGEYPVQQEWAQALSKACPEIGFHEQADQQEHSLEVQVPFLQLTCPKAQMVPLVVGRQDMGNVRHLVGAVLQVLEDSGQADRCAFLASSDAYHGHSLDELEASDTRLAELLEHMDSAALVQAVRSGETMACGYGPIAAVMEISRHLGATRGKVLKKTSSAADRPRMKQDYVVGYLASMFF